MAYIKDNSSYRFKRALSIFLGLFLASSVTLAQDLGNCTPFTNSEKPLERDYRILTSKAEIQQDSLKIYESDRRLQGRAYWDSSAGQMVIRYGAGAIIVPQSLTVGMGKHMESAIKNQYIDGVIYADMGHVHLQLPKQEWQQLKATFNSTLRMEKALASKNLKALYHTAEMVQLKDGDPIKGKLPQDPWRLWRYFSRNLFGSFAGTDSTIEVIWAGPKAAYNTVREIPDMIEVSTLYFSENKSGCFPYHSKEEIKFFDITFDTIPYAQ